MRCKVIQFNENHKWCGSFGYIAGEKQCADGIRYQVAVPVPLEGTAFIYVMDNEKALDWIGYTDLVLRENDNNE